MPGVTIIGGGGFAGSHIAEAAAVRGLAVSSVSRHEVPEQVGGVHYRIGSILDPADRARVLENSEIVIVAVSPRGDMAGRLRPAVAALAAEAAGTGVRLIVVGGAGSLQRPDGSGYVKDAPDFPEAARAEAEEMTGILEDLRSAPESVDWVVVSPAAAFGAHAAGEYRGEYRVGEDTLLVDDDGISAISGADFGVALVDEIESPTAHRRRITFAY